MTTYTLGSQIAGLKYQAKQTENGESVFVKNAVFAAVLTDSACTEITDIDYPSYHTYSVISISRVSAVATVTTVPNSLETGMTVTHAGATQPEYNVAAEITVTVPGSQYTYSVSGAPATPATGTIAATGGKKTVPGVVYLNGYMFVQDINGPIQNSANGDVTSWDPLSFITPEKEPSNPVMIVKSLNYLLALKEWDIEPFEDAGIAAPASPLAPVGSIYIKLGCATADSVVEVDGGVILMTKRDNLQRSREIHVLNGLTPQKISTPEVERILNADDLATCYALYLSTAGHQFYVLTLKTSAITLVYDFNNKLWYQWSFLTIQSSQTLTSLTQTDGIATATKTSHGFEDGDPVLIAGAGQAGYNGIQNVSVSADDPNTFTFPVDSATVSPATGTITARGYDESYFPAVGYATYQNLDLVLHETNGIIYSLEPATYQDNGVPINAMIRLKQWDNGNRQFKAVSNLRLVGDLVDADALIRDYDDDYETPSQYRRFDMSSQDTQLPRWGSTKRRAYEVKFTENAPFRVDYLEQYFTQGK